MRKAGLAKADKKSDRVAAEGIIAIETSADNKQAVMLEVNSETDFVAKADDFINFVNAVTQKTLEAQPADLETLLQLPLQNGESIDTVRQSLIAKIGENIQVRRFTLMNTDAGIIGAYRHGDRIGTLVKLNGGDENLAKDLPCMSLPAVLKPFLLMNCLKNCCKKNAILLQHKRVKAVSQKRLLRK